MDIKGGEGGDKARREETYLARCQPKFHPQHQHPELLQGCSLSLDLELALSTANAAHTLLS